MIEIIKTSLSDNGQYPEFCYSASKHEDILKNFKRHPIYNAILEHLNAEQGGAYLEIILNDYNFRLNDAQWENILLNDSLGNPRRFTYEYGNKILTSSATTLRYTKILMDIVSLFDTDKIKSVAEVGIGYGGQCRILMNMLPIQRYNLVDLPEVLALTEKFLTELNQQGDIRYIDGTHLYHDVPCDLLISNYAFAELTEPVQNIYLEKIVSRSKAGYMTWNSEMFEKQGLKIGYSAKEIISMIPGAQIIPEIPLTAPGNCIIILGTK